MGSRSRRRRAALALLAVLAGLVLMSACDRRAERQTVRAPGSGDDERIKVAAFDFPESRLLAELYAQVLEGAGYPVAPVLELGSREIVEPALQRGLVDVVPEYSGSALAFLEGPADPVVADARSTHRRLTSAFAQRGVVVAAAAPAQNRNVVVVRAETAEQLGVRAVSDLLPHADGLVMGGPPECPQRSTCLRGLRDVYGLTFERFLSLSPTRNVVAALEAGEIDVGMLFTTDPALVEKDLVALADDLSIQPAENIVPVVRDATVRRHGRALLDVLDDLSRRLTTARLGELNWRVQTRADPPAAVARSWLVEQGLRP
jgi:osmoprotectant transport system substrate-binding protein